MSEATIPVRVKQMRREADTVVSVEFETLDGSNLPKASPGAHVDVILRDDLRRSYSLTRENTAGPTFTVAIHRDPQSKGGSAFVHERLRVGDKVRISRPKNNFPLDETSENSVLIAGGIGITPILAMVRRLTEERRRWEVFYAARSRTAAAFCEELDTCVQASNGKGRVNYHFDDEQRGSLVDIRSIMESNPEAHFYCCGPEPMLAAYEAAAREVPRGQVHVEYFSATEEVARDGGFDRIGNALLGFERREARRRSVDLHLHIGDVRHGIDLESAEAVNAHGGENEHRCQHCETLSDRQLDNSFQHEIALLSDRGSRPTSRCRP